jgi:hypothetical protein
VKFSFRQILASAGGAVLAAGIASLFGVKGTIIGVAIGSAAATSGTAFLAQSIERGHKAVKQVVVQAPDSFSLLRRLGGTRAAGVTESAPADASALAEETSTSTVHGDDTIESEIVTPEDDQATQLLPTVPALAAEAPTSGAPTAEVPAVLAAAGVATETRRFRWPAIAGTAAIVFVLSLMFVTAVELIAGKPLADLFGGHSTSNAPTVVQPFESPATTVPPTSTTSTSTTTTSTSTTTTIPGTTTSTTGTGTTGTTTTVPDTSPDNTTTTAPG